MAVINYRVSTDAFENRYGTVTHGKGPEWGQEAVRGALEFVEDLGYSANEDRSKKLNMDHLNNATVTVTRIVGSMAREILALRAEVKQLREQVPPEDGDEV